MCIKLFWISWQVHKSNYDDGLTFFVAEGRNLPLERRHHIYENGTLSINKVIRKDAGLYACTATNRQGQSATQSGQLKVIGKLLFTKTANYWFATITSHIVQIMKFRQTFLAFKWPIFSELYQINSFR